MKRQQVFKILAILLPFMLLILFEVVLRLANYGYDTHLFKTAEDSSFWVMNRDVSKKYFTINQNATIGNQDVFYKKKPAGTLRIFVLGGSSSLAFPYMHNGSFARMLNYKLQFGFPQKTIEVINLSLTAINSYTLYDFSKQLVNYQPDAVLVYAGHNEYYGALGVASSSKLGHNPKLVRSILVLRKFKVIQLFTSLSNNLKTREVSLTDMDLTLMERMAARQEIPYNSREFSAGVKQFDTNLGDMLTYFEKHNIPVFIGTLASNLKGQKPLSKDTTSGIFNAWNEYKLGGDAYSHASFKEAKQHYLRSKEYDALRFRAPESFNEIIRKYSDRFNHVYLVDVAAKMVADSPEGIIGDGLMLEHVHPNLNGQRLMAEAFYDILLNNLPGLKNGSKENLEVDLAKDYPLTAFDSIYGDLVIWKLKQQWPFNEPFKEWDTKDERLEHKTAIQFFTRKINWGEAMQQLNNYYILEKDYAKALRIVEQMCLELPHEQIFLKQAGSLSLRLGQKEKAAFYLKQAGYGK